MSNALEQISGWSTHGAFGPYAPRDRTGIKCASTVQVQGKNFVRLWPPSGVYCGGQLLDVGPA